MFRLFRFPVPVRDLLWMAPMKISTSWNTLLVTLAGLALSILTAHCAPEQLFDGKSLAGWEATTPGVWRVRNGVIVGGSLAGNPQNEFLAYTRPFSNFVLRLEYKLEGSEGFVNGGVQFRSRRISTPPNEMSGFQADIGAGYSGCLYDESRRNKMLSKADPALIERLEKRGTGTLTKFERRAGVFDWFLMERRPFVTRRPNRISIPTD